MARTIATNRVGLRAFNRTSVRTQRARQRPRSGLIDKMKKRKHILGLTMREKLERNQPLSEIEWAYMERPPRQQHTEYTSSKTCHGFLKPTQISELDELCEKTPPILFRAFTTTGTRHTKGFATPTLYVPSGNLMPDMEGRRRERHPTWTHDLMADIPLEVLRVMVGEHLLWRDRIPDELLSWTMSYLFATVHLYRRHLDGQEIGYISMINRTRAVRPEKWYLERLEPQHSTPAKFNFANDFFIAYPEDDPLLQAAWKDLVAAGIFELIPELKIYFDSMVAGLYTVLRYIRTTNYNEVRRTTENELVIAQEIAWLHTRLPPGETREESRPNLWILLHTLTFRKRESGDHLFKDLIRKLGYTRADLDENLYATFGEFPSNLPELHSLYHLAVDVQAVVNGPPLPALVLTSTYSRVALPNGMEERDDADYDKTCKPKLIEMITKGYEIKRRCGLACDCAIWGPIQKPRNKKVDGSEQSEDADEHKDDQTKSSNQTEHSSLDESTLLVEQKAEHQIHRLDEDQTQHMDGQLQDPSDTESADSLGKSTASQPSWKDHELEQTSGSQSQRQSMHEELNTMLLTYKYVSKTNY
ncbi:hypothetical protein KCU71_g14566, partial [Aureobasidium melanogenum]